MKRKYDLCDKFYIWKTPNILLTGEITGVELHRDGIIRYRAILSNGDIVFLSEGEIYKDLDQLEATVFKKLEADHQEKLNQWKEQFNLIKVKD